jgi:hypothetical protein
MKIIGIYSPTPGCGKTELANMLLRFDPKTTARFPFAAPVKDFTISFLMQVGYSEEQASYFAYHDKNTPLLLVPGKPTARKLLQTIGTGWGRKMISNDIWLAPWLQTLDTVHMPYTCTLLVDDMRFPNEYYTLTKNNAFVVKITRESAPIAIDDSEGNLCHLPFDCEIENNGSLDDLWEHAKKIWTAVNAQ